jgi:hypothetical protein
MVMKKYVYYNHWLKDTAVKQVDHPNFDHDFEIEWKKQSKTKLKGKIISELVGRYGIRILDKHMLSLEPVLRTPQKDLPYMFDLVDANLTDSAKSLLLKSPVTIEAARIEELDSRIEELDSRIEELDSKWLNSTDIDLYLRFFHSFLTL